MQLAGVFERVTIGKGLVIDDPARRFHRCRLGSCVSSRRVTRAGVGTLRFSALFRHLVAGTRGFLARVPRQPREFHARRMGRAPTTFLWPWVQLQSLDIPSSLDWRYAPPANVDLGALVGLATGSEPASAAADTAPTVPQPSLTHAPCPDVRDKYAPWGDRISCSQRSSACMRAPSH